MFGVTERTRALSMPLRSISEIHAQYSYLGKVKNINNNMKSNLMTFLLCEHSMYAQSLFCSPCPFLSTSPSLPDTLPFQLQLLFVCNPLSVRMGTGASTRASASRPFRALRSKEGFSTL